MTGPKRPPTEPLAPVRRRSGSPSTQKAAPFTDAELARGQADAVMGALGRMQLRLDLLAREQSEALAKVLAAVERVEAQLSGLELVEEPASESRPG